MVYVALRRVATHLTALARAGRPSCGLITRIAGSEAATMAHPGPSRPASPFFSPCSLALRQLDRQQATSQYRRLSTHVPLDYGGHGLVDFASQLYAKDACSIPTAAQQQQPAARLHGYTAPRLTWRSTGESFRLRSPSGYPISRCPIPRPSEIVSFIISPRPRARQGPRAERELHNSTNAPSAPTRPRASLAISTRRSRRNHASSSLLRELWPPS